MGGDRNRFFVLIVSPWTDGLIQSSNGGSRSNGPFVLRISAVT